MSDNNKTLLKKFATKVKSVVADDESARQGQRAETIRNSILIVDDEREALDSLELQIEDKYRVYKATSGREALDILKSHDDIGLTIIDIRMPEMDGLELARQMEKIKSVEKIIRSAQIGRYGESLLLNEIGPYVMVDKSPLGTDVLLKKIEEALNNVKLAKVLTDRGPSKARDQRPELEDGQFHVPSIIGDNVNFGEGRWLPIHPFFCDRQAEDRKVIGYCNITPYYALQCAYAWAKEMLYEWSNTPITERLNRTMRAGERVKEFVRLAEEFEKNNGDDPFLAQKDRPGSEQYLRLKFIAESGAFPLKLLYEGIRETADFMLNSEKIAYQVFQTYGVKLDGPFPTIMPRGIVGGVTRVTMPHTAEYLTQPAAWTGNVLIRRGDLYCPGMTHFFQEMMMQEGIPTQQFFSITKENR